ncbi:MerR family transcriptional regulator [Nocardia flavorosea]|uniref:MerR family transcriptional regulator n=1 Tax=Nocardia flavorosea TaxID=53429 RepID=A0A846YID1_9NOCA|nr:MerR family transcriptional regulator [Nocardia flavorosea]NKY58663.1 MerR family transcriptional regulator [Nocardia flavorosea]
MRIGELSRRTGVSRRSLRYYEQNGLLRSGRSANGWREYDESCIGRVRKIADLLRRGLTMEGIGQLDACLDLSDMDTCDDPGHALEIYRARLAVLDDRLERLHEHRTNLMETLGELEVAQSRVPGPATAPGRV